MVLEQCGHGGGVDVQLLQQVGGPCAAVDVQGAGQRGVGVVGVAPAARQRAVQVVLDVQVPAGAAVDLRLVLLEPQDLRQRVVGVRAVAGHLIEVLEGDDVQDLLHLGFAAAVGVDDVGVERHAVFIHGDAAVHGARQAHAGDLRGADLLEQLADAIVHGLANGLRVHLRPVGMGVHGGVVPPDGAQRFAAGVEDGTFAAGGAGVTGEYQVFFHNVASVISFGFADSTPRRRRLPPARQMRRAAPRRSGARSPTPRGEPRTGRWAARSRPRN